MSRIRSIKPDFWTSEQVMECSTNARLLFIGVWNFCDDLGRHPMSPKQIKAQVFPGDNFTPENVHGMLNELAKNDLIRYYTVDDKEYFVVTGWSHQRIDKAQPAKYPAPADEHSEPIPGTFAPDRKGRDRRGEEGKGNGKEIAAQQVVPEIEKQDRVEVELRAAAGSFAPETPDITPVLELIDKGYDLAKHILPVIRDRAGKATKRFSSWRYFVPAIEESRAANGAIKPNGSTPTEPHEWLPAESPLWDAMAERWQHAKGKDLRPITSNNQIGLGAYIPKAWLDFAAGDLTGTVN